ncbi:uncharacterized protein LOC132039047 [Lycium ferocissimum]|uniref:uncharacterized protein LOC132039047 n=1 Tax=Lycium ferocissimum TaxID=112874 RepID=UPI0028157C8E|nr:uncharacterized protein LOC132039047 [Lycium ferocissimum]
MVKVLLRKWYPPSNRVEISDQIYEFNQRHGEKLFEAWERYKEYLDRSPNHGFPDNILKEKFYRGQAWHSSNSDDLSLRTPLIQNIMKDIRETQQTLAQLATNISLLMKRFDESEAKKNLPRPQQGQGAYNNNQGNYNNNYDGPNQGRCNNNNGNFKNRSSNPYIPPKGQSNDQGSSRLESMLEKMLASKTNTKMTLSGLSDIVVSHSAAIQNHEQQMRDLSREQYRARKGGHPSDTIPNPKNGGGGVECTFHISMRSDKIIQSTDKKVVDLDPVNEEEEVKSDMSIMDDEMMEKKNDDAKCQNFYDQLKQLTVNFPFLDAVKFDKFMKDLHTKKRSFQHETVNLTHQLSGLGMPRPTSMRLQMADRSIKRPVGVVDDVLIQVGKFMLPADFIILDCVVDKDIPIVLERPFLAAGRALIDSEKNKIKFRLNDEEVTFQASKGMKLPSTYENISVIDSFDGIDDAVEHKMEEESLGEALAAIR